MRTVELRILCEGLTESEFVSSVLKPHLAQFRVYARPERLSLESFGIVPFDKLRRAIKEDVGRSKSHQYVTTMIDLYKIGRYPGAEKVEGESPYKRVSRIETEMASGLPNDRFVPYVQLHEFEALVFVDLKQLLPQFPDEEAKDAPKKLRHAVGDTPPELINDKRPPGKRLISAIPAYGPQKAIAGPAIAREIGLPKLRAACPHFNEWLVRLEGIAG